MNELRRRLLGRYGPEMYAKAQLAFNKIDQTKLLTTPVDKLEAEVVREIGHWTNHPTREETGSPYMTPLIQTRNVVQATNIDGKNEFER